MASLPTNSEARITAFMDATSSSRDEAIQHLEMTEWDVTAAVDIWFQDETEEAEEPEDDAEPAAASNPVPNPTTARTSGSIHTLNDINPTTSAEHGADDEDGSDNDYFAGGEKSGLAVHGNPHGNPPPARGANELLQGLFDRARRNTARPGGDEDQAPPDSFGGRGFTLGGDDTPSRVIEPTAAPRPAVRVQRTLYLWLEGFSVDDGPLYRYDDPANHRTLAMIENGHAPIHILNVEPNQEVDLTLSSRKGEKYVKPKPRYKAFGGEGRRLGSPAAATDPVPSAPLETRALRALTALTTGVGLHDPEVELDDSQPVVSILFRLGDGTRLPARFNPSHTVQHLYEFVNAARALDVRNYVLMTTFPSTELTNRSLTLGEVPELKKGGAVVQKWT